MPYIDPDFSTDTAWEDWGRRDPYFGVITDPKFRRDKITEQSRSEFFDSGRGHVEYVLQMIRKHVDEKFEPRRVLDFGCGVGRVVIPFAGVAQEVVGLDVSSSMLREAERNCEVYGVTNARLLLSDDALTSLNGTFDLIHSCIVFQHIPVTRGNVLFAKLLQHLKVGGIGAVQLTYSKVQFASTQGLPPPELPHDLKKLAVPGDVDPARQMNPYNMNTILFMLQESQVRECYFDFTNHGGELGLFLFFRKT